MESVNYIDLTKVWGKCRPSSQLFPLPAGNLANEVLSMKIFVSPTMRFFLSVRTLSRIKVKSSTQVCLNPFFGKLSCFFSHCSQETLGLRQVKGENVYLHCVYRGGNVKARGLEQQLHSDGCQCSAQFLHVIQSRIPAQGMVPPTPKMFPLTLTS